MQHINVDNVEIMKANRMTFRLAKQKHDMLVLAAALHQHEANQQAVRDLFIDEDGITHEFGTPKAIREIQETEISKNVTARETPRENEARGIKYQIRGLQELRAELLDEEKYLEVQEAEELLVKLHEELRRIQNEL